MARNDRSKKGKPDRRIVESRSVFKANEDEDSPILGTLTYYHATKGWKTRKVTQHYLNKMG